MIRVRARRSWPTLVLLVTLGCGGAPSGPGFGGWRPPLAATPEIAALERQMLDRVNTDRRGAGLAPLTWDGRLADVARAHSLDMREHRFFAHASPSTGLLEDRLDRAGYLAREMRENLATARGVDRAEDNLLASPGHRANLLAPTVTHLGVGIVHGDPTGDPLGLTFTQVFALPARLDTPASLLAAVWQLLGADRRAAGCGLLTPHPLLQTLADELVGSLADARDDNPLAAIGEAVQSRITSAGGSGLRAVQLHAQILLDASGFDPPAAVADAALRHYGAAATPTHDARGRPRLALLLLLGR